MTILLYSISAMLFIVASAGFRFGWDHDIELTPVMLMFIASGIFALAGASI